MSAESEAAEERRHALLSGLTYAASGWRQSKIRERASRDRTFEQISIAAAAGMTEAEICRATGINRITVRKAMGK